MIQTINTPETGANSMRNPVFEHPDAETLYLDQHLSSVQTTAISLVQSSLVHAGVYLVIKYAEWQTIIPMPSTGIYMSDVRRLYVTGSFYGVTTASILTMHHWYSLFTAYTVGTISHCLK
jgi:hypothetical protein